MPFDGRLLAGVGALSAVIEAGSFVRAAEVLGVTASGVSHAIRRLEQRVGVRLLDRTTRSVRLSEEGRRFYERVKPNLAAIEEAASDAAGAAGVVRGRLRVNIDPLVSRTVLAGRLGGFLARHPELSLELMTRDQVGDLVSDAVDVAVRYGEPQGASLVARKLMQTRVLTLAAPAYLERRGRPTRPEDLIGHDCIHFREAASGRAFDWEFHRDGEVLAVPTPGRLMVSEAGTMLTECVAGTGVMQAFADSVADLLAQGKLVELFPDWDGEVYPLYALYPSRRQPPAKVRAFIDFVLEVLA
jgi:DNA-binding transcriptional LysR family regulator